MNTRLKKWAENYMAIKSLTFITWLSEDNNEKMNIG